MKTEKKTQPWYDSKEGIQDALKRGLLGLRELGDKRRDKGAYGEKLVLNEWIVMGRFYLDSCGNTMPITEGAPLGSVERVIPPDDLRGVRWVSSCRRLPPGLDPCSHCLIPWDLRTALDHHFSSHRGHVHQSCLDLIWIQEATDEINAVLCRAGLADCTVRAIPNQYSRDRAWPWFLVDVPGGVLRIGRRKRVINLDWSRAGIDRDGEVLFADQDVTKGKAMIHAWGLDDLVKYLRRLFAEDEA